MSEKNEVDVFLTDAKTLEARRQELIRSLVNQRDSLVRDFDGQLAKLGHKIDTRDAAITEKALLPRL